MLHKLALGVAATVLLTGPAIAAQATQETVTVTAQRDQVICRTHTAPGSRLGSTRTCMTRQGWEMRRARAQENLVHVQDNALFVNSVMGMPGG